MKEDDKKKYNTDTEDLSDKKTISESDTEKLIKLVDRNAEIIRKFRKDDEILN